MFDSTIFFRIFDNVLKQDILSNNVQESEIQEAVRIMAVLYAPQSQNLKTENVTIPDFYFISHRCAYLHKYAAFHTTLVYDMMQLVLQHQWLIFQNFVLSRNFKLCCLGGGPGSDAIGVLAALSANFANLKMDVTIVDIMEKWKMTFASVVKELKQRRDYGCLQTVAQNFLEWDYIGANLLDTMAQPVNRAIASADLVTMVKFVSAAACQETEDMMMKFFSVMKPGAMVLFIDNAGGGFNRLVQKAAKQSRLVLKFTLEHHPYSNESMKFFRFGYQSCCETKVAVYLLQKLHGNKKCQKQNNIPNNSNRNPNTVRIHQPLSAQTVPNLDKIHSNSGSSQIHPKSSQNHNCNENEIKQRLSAPKTASKAGPILSQTFYRNESEKNLLLSAPIIAPNVGKMASNFKTPQAPCTNAVPSQNYNRIESEKNLLLSASKIAPNVGKMSSNFKTQVVPATINPTPSQSYNRNESKITHPPSFPKTTASVDKKYSNFVPPHNITTLAQNLNLNEQKLNFVKNNISPPKNPYANSKLQQNKSNVGHYQSNMGRENNNCSYGYISSAPTSSDLTPTSEANASSNSNEATCCSCCVIS